MTERRQSKRIWFVMLGVFVAVGLFAFLMQRSSTWLGEADAASTAGFDPGYIISDYQMSNYNSMNEGQIQQFLKAHNACNDTYLNRAGIGTKVDYYSEASPTTWHVGQGHFVCMADENVNGESAAHIIWRAAQDYKINPQVLLVLLEKEQTLVSDKFPHSIQYRSATGYGCPDTAACSSKYYGLKNQIRNAASMFRTVLDGGWSNYPVGNNYIQYSPNAACGGSVVNIRNRATSALYRYTPYQPNAAALAAGYGTASCGAYGNRNFYLYFQDWFGGITSEAYENFITPRYMKLTKKTDRVNTFTGAYFDTLESGRILKYTTKIFIRDKWYYRSEVCTNSRLDVVVPADALEEMPVYEEFISPRNMILTKTVKRINPYTKEVFDTLEKGRILKYTTKIMIDNQWYYRSENCTNGNLDVVVPAEALDEAVL